MKKRMASLLLVLAMCFAMLPTAAFAAEDEGNTRPEYSGGSGTQKNPWLISSVEDLQLLANTINDGNAAGFDADCPDTGDGIPGNYHGYYFKQTTDLDLSSIENWDPIGYSGSCYFAGHYDGDGHTISNAKSTGKNDNAGFATAGVFGWVFLGSVKNLTVENANFVATGQGNYSFVGGVAAVAFAASIENCTVKNSALESKRDNNNNCAGGVAGYSAGATFKNCASISNNIQSMAYGGGFVGENDDDNEVDNSTYTDCYAVNCSVTAKTDDAQGESFAGGFVGEMTNFTLTIQNCYVYRVTLSTEGTAVSGTKGTGVFAARLWNGCDIVDTNCFFGACGTTETVGDASEKTEEEFTNGIVAGLLGEAFAQGKLYPVFATDPADYSDVDAAIAKANALTKSDYTDFTAVDSAVNKVVRGKKITKQSEVDAMAKAIEDAIAGLVARPSSSGSSSSGGSSKPSYSVTAPGATNGSVTASPKNATKGSTVTVTVKPDDGYQLDKLTVTDAKGGTISVTDKGNGKYTFTMPASKVTVTPTFSKIEDTKPSKNGFDDVASSAWYADAVQYVTDKGLMNGTGSDTFSPNASTTRGMLMTVLARYAGADTTGGATWYEKGMEWAKAKGVSDGTNPNADITREQLVTMLYRYAGSPKANDSFSDAASVSSYAVNAMQWAVANGIVNGSNGKLNPQNNATRAEVAAILMRFCEMSK